MNEKDVLLKNMLRLQRDELTSCIVYQKLAKREKDPHNSQVLSNISAEERNHYVTLRSYTKQDVAPNRFLVFFYMMLVHLLGITFVVRQMELNEKDASEIYKDFPDTQYLAEMALDEERHEQQLISMINEERLEYMGSVVLGLNDALVEFTGALAGFTLALNDSKLIALTGSITGIAAALSMASSEYLSTKSDKDPNKRPVKAAIYTGIAYVITVVALVTPFVLISTPVIALCVMLMMALLIIAFFNYYYSVARNESFKRRFTEMAALSFSVAAISFLIGYLLKTFTGIEG